MLLPGEDPVGGLGGRPTVASSTSRVPGGSGDAGRDCCVAVGVGDAGTGEGPGAG